VIVEAI